MISTWAEFQWHRAWGKLLAIIFAFSLIPGARAIAKAPDADPVCNPAADYFLGRENYPEAVRLHRLVIQQHPEDALAHYHLGFAEGMMGNRTGEIDQYRLAAGLGLKDWDLYLNLGRAYLEGGEVGAAASALQQAAALGPDHPEAHFNLGLAYERQGQLGAASAELTRSLALDPSQADARNMLALLDAEQGDYPAAQAIWIGLAKAHPNFAPAQANLAILDAKLKRGTPAGSAAFQSASAGTTH